MNTIVKSLFSGIIFWSTKIKNTKLQLNGPTSYSTRLLDEGINPSIAIDPFPRRNRGVPVTGPQMSD
jgi:hypothetical protein